MARTINGEVIGRAADDLLGVVWSQRILALDLSVSAAGARGARPDVDVLFVAIVPVIDYVMRLADSSA